MLKVALTGNIAAGKSTVVRRWRAEGALVIESDELARKAVEPGTSALERIRKRWGPGVLLPDGSLDRAAMRDLVFRDRTERMALEEIIHPEVRRLRAESFGAAEADRVPIAVADIPLLFETGLEKEFDVVVLVDAPARARLRRLTDDRHLSEEEATRMIAAQWPAREKRAKVDFIIDNGGSIWALEARAEEVWAELVRRAETGSAG